MKFKFARGLVNCRSGNVATLIAIMFLPMLFFVGGSVDFIRISNAKAKLQAAAEAGALAAASFNNLQPEAETAQNYVLANVADDSSIVDVQTSIDTPRFNKKNGSSEVQVNATAKVPLSFLQLLGHEYQEIRVSATALEERGDVEISLILGMSGSMGVPASKLRKLQTAAKEFVDTMLMGEASKQDYFHHAGTVQ